MSVRVLIVDDNDFEREGIEFVLKQVDHAFSIESVEDGAASLKKLQQKPFDLLITDIKMPILDGIELIYRIRDFDQAIKIIVISGFQDFEYARKLLNMGVSDYLLKPVNPVQLIDAIKKAVQIEEKDEKYSPVIRDVLEIVHDEYMNPLSLEEISNRVFLSSGYLSNTFKEEVGIVFSKYLMNYRINKAKQLLSDSNMKIVDIAKYVGIENISYFNRIFKKAENMTPLIYREKSKDEKI